MPSASLYDKISLQTSKLTTEAYSTSFSVGIRCLQKELRGPIYSIYGFVRFADEIVDTHHGYDQRELLRRFRNETFLAIREGISTNPILHSLQQTVNRYAISHELIETFLKSMAMDLTQKAHNERTLGQYVLGSAESVGLMCLHVFCNGDHARFESLKPYAMKLGSAFQKVNFLRDLNADLATLGRSYFPEVEQGPLTLESKKKIEKIIAAEFEQAIPGIRQLPRSGRLGVYLAYLYYKALFAKIRNKRPEALRERIGIPTTQKLSLLCYSFVRHQLNLI